MHVRDWAAIDVAADATGKLTGPMVELLAGREYALVPPNSLTAPKPIGRLKREGAFLMCHPHAGGEPFALDARAARGMVFDVPAEGHQVSQVSAGVLSKDARIALLGKLPAWAQRTAAEHLMPREVAEHDAAVKAARVAHLRSIGAAASGKGSIPASNSADADTAARAAQLREIGRAASRR